MSSRVALVEASQAPVSCRHVFTNGDPGPLAASWAQVPELLDVTMPFLGTILGASSIPVRLKELVILRTSAVMQCRFCVNAHTEIAVDVGLTEPEIRALRGDVAQAASFALPSELALLKWVDAVAGHVGFVDDDVAQELQRHFRDHEIVEITMLIGATLMLNRYASALQLPNNPASILRLEQLGYDTAGANEGVIR